jgi:hypothetical protein
MDRPFGLRERPGNQCTAWLKHINMIRTESTEQMLPELAPLHHAVARCDECYTPRQGGGGPVERPTRWTFHPSLGARLFRSHSLEPYIRPRGLQRAEGEYDDLSRLPRVDLIKPAIDGRLPTEHALQGRWGKRTVRPTSNRGRAS